MDTTTTTPNEPKNLQDDLKESAYRIWLAGLGALAAAGEEGAKAFTRLVDRGREAESRSKDDFKAQADKAREQFDKAKGKAEGQWDEWSGKLDEALTRSLHRLGVPTRDEIRTLTQRVEELTAKVEGLKPRGASAETAAEPVIVTPGSPDPTDPTKIVS
ncbi:MAG TPA: phasin family protein [Thermoanaerobaculia bacterium]|nr:phasin family protein [Thermoanaerobaculia bacterium]